MHFLEESFLELLYVDPVCTNVRDLLSTNNCIMAATAISAASVPSFPPATPFIETLSLTRNHSRCWHYWVRYKPACIDWLVLSLFTLFHTAQKKSTVVFLYYVLVQCSCYSYVLLRYVLCLHSTTYLTGKRGLDGNDLLCEYLLYESQQQFK